MRADRWAGLFAGAAAALSLSCNAIIGPTQPDGNWNVSHRGRLTFYVRPNSFAEQSLDTLAAVLDDQLTVGAQTLALRYDGHVTVFCYSSGADADFGNDGGGADHSGVAYPANETIKAACVAPLDANLLALVSHEVNHVIVRNGLGLEGTTFMNEGLASALISERYHSQGKTFYYHWTATHRTRLPHLSALVDDEIGRAHV